MKIALVAPSGVPFVVGGAEKSWIGLLNYVNQHTPHAMDLIKLPSPERNFWEVVSSYRKFAALDLSHFDLVISTKYPSWMVSHHNHIVYMLHTLRGLYDTYPAHLPTTLKNPPECLRELWELLQGPKLARSSLPDIFGLLDQFKNDQRISDEAREKLTVFPGPLARAVVQALDRIGLSETSIKRYFAISRMVAGRENYFPPSTHVEVVPTPSNLTGFHCSPGEFIFTTSRLDPPKRIDLIIQAYRRLDTEVPLVISGEGPAEQSLKKIADGDPRIRFTGRLSDEDLISHYARAVFVPFVPYQEDMGLITVEAMKSGKPVLTVDDSGGVTEFVRDGINGRIVPADTSALADAMNDMLRDPEQLARMGMAARSTGETVSWKRTVETLLADAGEQPSAIQAFSPPSRRRLLVLNTFSVFPPDNGGKKRIFFLYQALSSFADITLLNLSATMTSAAIREFNPHYREILIPHSAHFSQCEADLTKLLKRPVTDIAALLHSDSLPELEEAFVDLLGRADIVVACHVYLYPLISKHWRGELWYDALNVEADMKAVVLNVPPAQAAPPHATTVTDSATAVAQVAHWEAGLVRTAARVFAVSEADLQRFEQLYGRPAADMELAPNGTAAPLDPWLEAERRAALKANLGFEGRPVALFVGSYHGPNLDAADLILSTAHACPEWSFWVAGSVCMHSPLQAPPPNVFRIYPVSDSELAVLSRATDVALNPVLSGSGTNLKILDYAAHGALILSTPTGVRGLKFKQGSHYLSFEPDTLPQLLHSLVASTPSPHLQIRKEARRLVERHYLWESISATTFKPVLSQK